MQKSIFWFLCLFLMGSSGVLKGQQQGCYTESSPNFLSSIPSNEFKLTGEHYIFRVYVHIIRDDEGEYGRTPEEAEILIDVLNNAFNQLDVDPTPEIEFSLESIDYIDCERYFTPENGLIDEALVNDLITEREHLDGIDIYLLDKNTVDGMEEPVWGGFAYAIPSTAMVIGGNIPADVFFDGSSGFDGGLSNIVAHEMGHCLGLYHLFEGDFCYPQIGSPSCQESQTNGKYCGDFVEDTGPIWNRVFRVESSTNGCTVDPSAPECINTAVSYDESGYDLINYMQYTHPECMALFTSGQQERMFDCIANTSFLQKCLTNELNTYEDVNDLVIEYTPPTYLQQSTTLNTGTTVWSDSEGYEITGMITVPNGAELIIQNTRVAFLTETSGITVQKGGVLRIVNAQLTTNKCTENVYRWKGIVVYGQGKNPSNLPPPYGIGKHAFLSITNNSKIERADIGILVKGLAGELPVSTVWASPGAPLETMNNGVLNVENTIFRDNQTSIKMQYLFDESAKNNKIRNSSFSVRASLATESITHIDLNKAGLIDIQSNEFSAPALSFVFTAIKAHNTSIKIGVIHPEDGNRFSDFFTAIDVYSSLNTTLTEIENNNFQNNKHGITLQNTAMSTIRGNVFLIPHGLPVTHFPVSASSYGVFTHNAIAFDISRNHFQLVEPPTPARDFSGHALVMVNSHDDHGFTTSIAEENTFCGTFTAATQFERSNTDLQMHCNHYQDCVRDWFLAQTLDDPNNDITDELEKQGNCGGGIPSAFTPLGNEWHVFEADTWHILNQSDAQLVMDWGADSQPDFSLVEGPFAQGASCGNEEALCAENALDACGLNEVHRVEETSSGKGDYYTALQNNDSNGMIALLENEQAEWSDKWLVGIYTGKEEFTQASQTLNRIPQNTPSNIIFHQLFATVIQAKGNFSPSQEQLIRSHTSNKDTQISTLAEMFLAEYFDETIERHPMPVVTSSSKRSPQIDIPLFKIYPNPARGEVKVHFSEELQSLGNSTIHILDFTGKVIQSISVDSLNSIDIGNLSNGVYMVSLQTSEKTLFTEKLVIVK
ncbi:MAG: T9SS type A sorting domain-containing protein [Chitinophagales bacterium]